MDLRTTDDQPYGNGPISGARSDVRVEFIRRTYMHLAGAILAFIGLEYLLFQTPLPGVMLKFMSASSYSWLVILGAFIGVSWISEKWAYSSTSPQQQYMGLGLFVLAEAIIFLPMLFIAANFSDASVIPNAAITTLGLFTGLTFVAFTTKKDFSFLGGIIKVGFLVAFGAIIAGALFGFTLGLFFSFAMVLLAAASILYSTSNILREFPADKHVAAALSLFSSVALLFWYVLQIFMAFGDD